MSPLPVLLSLAVGVPLGLLLRDRLRAQLVVAGLVPLLSLLAFAAQFIPGGGSMVCTSFTTVSGGVAEQTPITSCGSVPNFEAWGGPLPASIALALVLLSFAPLLSLRLKSWLPAGVAAVLAAVPQAISMGFFHWLPALVLTIAMAFARPARLTSAPAQISTRTGDA
jgi:hypothetical protein